MNAPEMNFGFLVASIEQTHRHFQQQAARAVNVSLTLRNWLVGFYIVEFEQNGLERAAYGKNLIDALANKLTSIKGMDRRSLFRFRDFYLQYPQVRGYVQQHLQGLPTAALLEGKIVGLLTPLLKGTEKVGLQTPQLPMQQFGVSADKLIEKLSYTHIEQLLGINDSLKRTFYEIECIKGTWTVRELKRQINSLYYERSGMSAKPELLGEITGQKAESAKVTDWVKSVYAFEFLGLRAKDAVEENDLETALLDQLQDFMLELGHGFCLEARQKKLLIGNEYFFVDLVFYHRILKCHVLVELKVEDFNHHNIGQLNTYVSYYKAEVMRPDDNPTIGILLVTDKNNALVEYATAGMDNQLFISKYLLQLPKKESLEAFIKREMESLK